MNVTIVESPPDLRGPRISQYHEVIAKAFAAEPGKCASFPLDGKNIVNVRQAIRAAAKQKNLRVRISAVDGTVYVIAVRGE